MNILKSSVLVAAALTAGNASALSYVPVNDYTIKYQNWEIFTGDLAGLSGTVFNSAYLYAVTGGALGAPLPAVTATAGTDLKGIFHLTSTYQGNTLTTGQSANAYFNDGDGGLNLWGVFGKFEIASIVVNASGVTEIKMTGGELELYSVPGGNLSPSTVEGPGLFTGEMSYTGITDVGTLLLSATLRANPFTGHTILATYDPSAAIKGQGNFSLDVGATTNGVGLNNPQFDANGVPYLAALCPAIICLPNTDARAANTWDFFGPGSGNGWLISSNDPIEGFTIPEPGTVGLIGLALMGLGARRLRKQQG